LRDLCHQAELLRAGDHEVTQACPFGHHALQAGKKFGAALHFVEHGTIREMRKELPWVQQCALPRFHVFKSEIGLVGEQLPRQRCLAGLTGPGQGDNRKTFGQLPQQRRCLSFDHLYKWNVRIASCTRHGPFADRIVGQKRVASWFRYLLVHGGG